MSRFGVLAILFCLVMVLGAGLSTSAYAQTCAHKDSIKCTVEDVPYTGDSHDVCKGHDSMKWKMIVTVTDDISRNAILRFRVKDGMEQYRFHDVHSGLLDEGTQTITSGPYSLNRLENVQLEVIWRQPGQGFEGDIHYVVDYFTSQPQ